MAPDCFIQQVEIKKLLHLENITIPLAKEHKKHLILTGKNGSGKTKTLEAIKEHFEWLQKIAMLGPRPIIPTRDKLLPPDKVYCKLYQEPNAKLVDIFENLILCHFDARRPRGIMIEPNGVQKIDPLKNPKIDQSTNSNFLEYLVHLDIQRDRRSQLPEVSAKLDEWFEKFINVLRKIFDDEKLEFKFESNVESLDYKHKIYTDSKEPFTLNQLSSGYAAIIDIISEILFRMQATKFSAYDVPGIVLIDEVDVHLHVELQKNVLPLLTTFFPNIQFIVTTHSPFVLTSIENAVIYDLENKVLTEDLSAYSYEGIVEYYFKVDQYSEDIKAKVKLYETLSEKEKNNNLTSDELSELLDLNRYFEQLMPNLANKMLELSPRMSQLSNKYEGKV